MRLPFRAPKSVVRTWARQGYGARDIPTAAVRQQQRWRQDLADAGQIHRLRVEGVDFATEDPFRLEQIHDLFSARLIAAEQLVLGDAHLVAKRFAPISVIPASAGGADGLDDSLVGRRRLDRVELLNVKGGISKMTNDSVVGFERRQPQLTPESLGHQKVSGMNRKRLVLPSGDFLDRRRQAHVARH
jgi:hypothetical protein